MNKCQLVKEEEAKKEEVSVEPEPKPIASALIHGSQIDRYVEQSMKIVFPPMKKNKSWKSFFCCHR